MSMQPESIPDLLTDILNQSQEACATENAGKVSLYYMILSAVDNSELCKSSIIIAAV